MYMLQAIYYKEWIKTCRMVGLLLVLFLAILIYSFITINQSFRVAGAVSTWNSYLQNDILLLPHLKWIPLLGALILSLGQFVPEMTNQRLKLTLHLPLPETRTISYLLFYGLSVLTALYVVTYLVLWGILAWYYPVEIVTTELLSVLPWFIAGWAGYLLTSWVCMESSWKQRIKNAILSICFLSYFFIDSIPGSYNPFVPFLLLFTVICFTFPFFSARRFKEGIGVR
ncbi:MAG: hypothetical protein LIP01_08265 [Tannerellaceae bacterium]|nr:hypothetical protein [Tannerellaceae bacterium]